LNGPSLLTRALSVSTTSDQFGNIWQYHSRSDEHSKVACWGILFDLLQHCPLLRQHAAVGKISFGINHRMGDFTSGRRKYLDLVICTPSQSVIKRQYSFSSLVAKYSIHLSANEQAALGNLPMISRTAVGSVLVAVEAKACMTEHVKALPRLYDELNSSHLAIHNSSDEAIAVGFAMINASIGFNSADRNKYNLTANPPFKTIHRQPNATNRAIAKVLEIPRRARKGAEGFDALGIVVIEMANDGSPVGVSMTPGITIPEPYTYDSMIYRIAALYATNFSNL